MESGYIAAATGGRKNVERSNYRGERSGLLANGHNPRQLSTQDSRRNLPAVQIERLGASDIALRAATPEDRAMITFGARVFGLGVIALGLVSLAWGEFDFGQPVP
jgi:hypothetical protein